MDAGGVVIARVTEITEAFELIEYWKRIYKLRLGPNFLLIPGHKLYSLERLLATETWVKARLCAATRVTGVRQLNRNGLKGPCNIFELKAKHLRALIIGKLDGTWKKLELPLEAENPDFWMGSWILQMSNMLWKQTPRQAALLIHQDKVIPPWTRLREIPDFGG